MTSRTWATWMTATSLKTRRTSARSSTVETPSLEVAPSVARSNAAVTESEWARRTTRSATPLDGLVAGAADALGAAPGRIGGAGTLGAAVGALDDAPGIAGGAVRRGAGGVLAGGGGGGAAAVAGAAPWDTVAGAADVRTLRDDCEAGVGAAGGVAAGAGGSRVAGDAALGAGGIEITTVASGEGWAR